MMNIEYPIWFGGVLSLGRRGENNARAVIIDVSDYVDTCPDAEITLWVQRPGEKSVYPANTELKDGKLYWQITSADTAIAGKGCAEMRVTRNDILIKSRTFTTQVSKSLTGAEIETPKPEQDWVDRILSAIAKIQNVHVIANGVPSDTPAGAEYDPETNTIRLSIPAGKDGEAGGGNDLTKNDILTALDYTPIRDVKMRTNNTDAVSIVEDGEAIIPLAGVERLGAVKIRKDAFCQISTSGYMWLSPATNSDIDSHANNTKALSPVNMDYAVRCAMCDGKGAAWTEEEQQAARSRMGLNTGWELIEEITLTDSMSVVRTNRPDGTPYRLRKLFILFISPGTDTDTVINQNIYVDEENIYNYGVKTIGVNAGAESILYAEVANNLLKIEQVFVKSKSGSAYEANTPRTAYRVVAGDAITQVNLSTMPSGTTIKIYGVKL